MMNNNRGGGVLFFITCPVHQLGLSGGLCILIYNFLIYLLLFLTVLEKLSDLPN